MERQGAGSDRRVEGERRAPRAPRRLSTMPPQARDQRLDTDDRVRVVGGVGREEGAVGDVQLRSGPQTRAEGCPRLRGQRRRGGHTVSTVAEEDAYWVKQVENLHHDALTNVRASAGKWQAGLTAALGGFVTVGFVWGPDKLDKYPIEQGLWRTLSLVLLVLAGVTGLCPMV